MTFRGGWRESTASPEQAVRLAGMPRLIAEKTIHGHWDARAEDRPETGVTGPTARVAIVRLCGVLGLKLLAYVEAEATHERVVYRPRVSEQRDGRYVDCPFVGENPCPDCGGSGTYVGLNTVETCPTCGGAGDLS
jgi:hypothetical protein